MDIFEDEPNPTKVVFGKSISKQIVACSFGKTSHVATVPFRQCWKVNFEWYITISFEKFEKRTRKGESLITMAIRVLAHRLKSQALHSPDQAPNDFFLFPHIRNDCVVNDFRIFQFFEVIVNHRTIRLKNVKLCYKIIKLHLEISKICQTRNLSSNPRICNISMQ